MFNRDQILTSNSAVIWDTRSPDNESRLYAIMPYANNERLYQTAYPSNLIRIFSVHFYTLQAFNDSASKKT